MTYQGCYGVRIFGKDKLTFYGKDAFIMELGMYLIEETIRCINIIGYDNAILRWRIQAEKLILLEQNDCQYETRSIQDILDKGKTHNATWRAYDTLTCQWIYVLDLDYENFQIYTSNRITMYPCSLIATIPLRELESFNPYTFLMPEDE